MRAPSTYRPLQREGAGGKQPSVRRTDASNGTGRRMDQESGHRAQQPEHRLCAFQWRAPASPLVAARAHLAGTCGKVGSARARGAPRVDAVLGRLGRLHRVKLKVKGDRVDRDRVLARVVLQRAGHEGLHEEEVGHREAERRAVVDPRLEKVEPLEQLGRVRREWLERRVGDLLPERGQLVDEHRARDALEVGAHHDQALDGLLQVLERAAHAREQLVEALQLLADDGVHRLGVEHGVAPLRHLDVKVGGQLVEDVLGHVGDDLVRRLGRAAAARLRLRDLHRAEHLVDLAQVLGDVGVRVEAEDLGQRHERPLAHVLHRLLDRAQVVDGHAVLARRGQREVVLQDARAVDVEHGRRERPPVLVVGHAAAVVALGREVVERSERHLLVEVEEHRELPHRDAQ
eukprot:5196121-Prymnesium_polylepis.1